MNGSTFLGGRERLLMQSSVQSAPATGADGGTDFAVGIARLVRLSVPAPCGFCNWEASRRRGERGLRKNPSIRVRTRKDCEMIAMLVRLRYMRRHVQTGTVRYVSNTYQRKASEDE